MDVQDIVIRSEMYSDLPEPVILAKGDLGIDFINAEKGCMSDTEFIEEHAENPGEMIAHSLKLAERHEEFKSIIDLMALTTKELAADYPGRTAIAGGQRKDWIFSGPIAKVLGLPHIALFKNGRSSYSTDPTDHSMYDAPDCPMPLSCNAIWVSDLLTAGSSGYNDAKDPPTGWIQMLRDRDVNVDHHVTLITRLQGGEAALERAGVTTHAMLAIDDDFLLNYSNQPDRAIAYRANPQEWTRDYLGKGSFYPLLKFFDGGKVQHGINFVDRYGEHLKSIGRYAELDKLVQEEHGRTIDEICGGE